MTKKFDGFIEELKCLCQKHGVCIGFEWIEGVVGVYDAIEECDDDIKMFFLDVTDGSRENNARKLERLERQRKEVEIQKRGEIAAEILRNRSLNKDK